ncbi:MAG: peptidoglycan-N-acetylglucosamine deacetylase [Gaiellaceae bacterium]|nr:peptidoglycan-N-acetylglucosamine deacetylase [Gaiellaceae bacterium]
MVVAPSDQDDERGPDWRAQRRAAERRRRHVARRRAGALAAGAAILLVVVLVAAGGGGGTSRQPAPTRSRVARPDPRTIEARAVDGVLAYTPYVLRGTPRHREVALTFDDGPGPYTPKVLRVLRELHVPATFFVVGNSIRDFGGLLEREHREGYPLGDHTKTHPLMGHLSRAAQRAELLDPVARMRSHGIATPRLFRPPDGSFDADTLSLLHEQRMLMVLWSINPEDYFRPGVTAIVSRVMRGIAPGGIVLMHDGGGDRSQTVAALPLIVRRLRARGYRLVSVPQLLLDDPPPRGQKPPPNLSGV